MKKLYPLLSVLFLIFWGCLDPLNIFDTNDEETVNLWGVDYSIENTTELDFNPGWGLTGPIPPEIGNLTNLTELDLSNNQLTGEIPESICDLDISWGGWKFNISNNQLCPPYLSCIENYVGT